MFNARLIQAFFFFLPKYTSKDMAGMYNKRHWTTNFLNSVYFSLVSSSTPGGHLYLKLDIILIKIKKIHVIRVVFQDQAMYARTSFRGAKTCKIGKKGMFLVILTNFGKDMTDKLRKAYAKTRI